MILLDTSVLIDPPDAWPAPVLGSSAICLAELLFGVQTAPTASARSFRTRRLAVYRSMMEWIPFEEPDAESYATLAALVARKRPSHARSKDMLIAAQALTLGVPLITRNARDFELVRDVVEILDAGRPSHSR